MSDLADIESMLDNPLIMVSTITLSEDDSSGS